MPLQPPASVLYPHRMTRYRPVETFDYLGKPSVTYAEIEEDIPCVFQAAQSVQYGILIARGESDNMFTYEQVRSEFPHDSRPQDILKQTVGPSAGAYYRQQGWPEEHPQFGDYQQELVARLERKPHGVP